MREYFIKPYKIKLILLMSNFNKNCLKFKFVTFKFRYIIKTPSSPITIKKQLTQKMLNLA